MQPSHKSSRALRAKILWTALGTLIGGLDAWRDTKHDGTTISEILREWTDHPINRTIFLLVLAGFARHILHKPTAPR
jgi:hypothetical protein